jgi:3,4-dihydroxy 2-butanone 4-phosphate synthase/GTP cyclohydrolase II
MNSDVATVVETFRRGGIVIVLDDDDRENEGDFILAAQFATPENINFLAAEGRGLICAALSPERAKKLNLTVPSNANALHGTAFTESVDLAALPGTGISASDRAETLRALAHPQSKPEDFARPGHVFPLVGKAGGVLERRGHTEATLELCRLAGLEPVGVLCEIMRPDGTMARRPDLEVLAAKNGFPLLTVEQLVRHRLEKESPVRETSVTQLPTLKGVFEFRHFVSPWGEVLTLSMGNLVQGSKPPLVRIHSECLTGEVFASLRCDCGPQLDEALDRIAKEGRGVLVYLRQEGRGIGLEAKIKAYALQDQGMDTWEANTAQGLPPDARSYDAAAQILSSWGVQNVRLMTNNPAKIEALKRHHFDVEIVPLVVPPGPHNQRYLETKKKRFGHLLDSGDSAKGV